MDTLRIVAMQAWVLPPVNLMLVEEAVPSVPVVALVVYGNPAMATAVLHLMLTVAELALIVSPSGVRAVTLMFALHFQPLPLLERVTLVMLAERLPVGGGDGLQGCINNKITHNMTELGLNWQHANSVATRLRLP